MTSSSVSFRITRNTQDLAETIHALSQRLVRIEQRLAALETELAASAREEECIDPAQIESLDSVERLLRDCRDLLDCSPLSPILGELVAADLDEDVEEDTIAAA